jgi:hypothetical protein
MLILRMETKFIKVINTFIKVFIKLLKIFIIYMVCVMLLIFLLIYIYNIRKTIIEPFSSVKNIILLGDSVFKNNLYVSDKNSVESILDRRIPHLINNSQDGAVIVDLYSQMEKIPDSLNVSNTNVFVSCGGNDLINYYFDKRINNSNLYNIIDDIFQKYSKFIDSLCVKMDKCNIVLLDIYYPKSNQYIKYYPLIEILNKKLYDFTSIKGLVIIQISDSMTEEDDFTHQIEPSLKGGEKIANAICDYSTL